MVPGDHCSVISQGPELETTGASDKVGLKDKPGEILEHGMEGGRGAGDSAAWGTPPHCPDLQGFWASTLCSAELGRVRITSAPEGSSVQVALLMGPGCNWMTEYSRSVVPTQPFCARDQLHGRQFFQGWGWGWFQDDSHKEHTT